MYNLYLYTFVLRAEGFFHLAAKSACKTRAESVCAAGSNAMLCPPNRQTKPPCLCSYTHNYLEKNIAKQTHSL